MKTCFGNRSFCILRVTGELYNGDILHFMTQDQELSYDMPPGSATVTRVLSSQPDTEARPDVSQLVCNMPGTGDHAVM